MLCPFQTLCTYFHRNASSQGPVAEVFEGLFSCCCSPRSLLLLGIVPPYWIIRKGPGHHTTWAAFSFPFAPGAKLMADTLPAACELCASLHATGCQWVCLSRWGETSHPPGMSSLFAWSNYSKSETFSPALGGILQLSLVFSGCLLKLRII